MGFEHILYEVGEGVCLVTLNRPDKLNALSGAMLAELLQSLELADADDAVRVVIVTGAGRAFCAGADLSAGAQTFDNAARGRTAHPEEHRDGGGAFSLRAFDMKKPMIAAINGPAVGFGITMTLPTSIFEAGVALSVWEAAEFWYTGRVPKPLGTAHRMSAPYQAFRASDGHFTVGASNEKLWPLFAGVLGLDHLGRDPRFATVTARLENRGALQELVEQVTSTEPRHHWLARCEAVGIPAGPIYSVPEALADPHAQARGMVQEINHPVAGRVKGLGNPVKLSASPATMRKAAPVLGEDTEPILAELGYDTGEIARLREKGVLGP